MPSSCSQCSRPNASAFCSRCKSVFYCNTTCQRNDWKHHKLACKKLAIQKSNQEDIILNKVEEKRKLIAKYRQNIKKSQKTLSENVKNCKQKINETFNEMLELLQDQRERLLNEVDDIIYFKEDRAAKQISDLNNYEQKLNKCYNESNELIQNIEINENMNMNDHSSSVYVNEHQYMRLCDDITTFVQVNNNFVEQPPIIEIKSSSKKIRIRKNLTDKDDLLVFGYVQQIENDHNFPTIVDNQISEKILSFLRNFDWENSEYATNGMHPFQFGDGDNYNPKILKIISCDYTSMLALEDNVICCKNYKKIEWKIKFVQHPSGHCIYFMFGFVEYPIDESIRKWGTHFGDDSWTNDRQFGVWMYASGDYPENFYLYGRDVNSTMIPSDKKIYKFKDGDTFQLSVDCISKTCSLYYNDALVADIYRNLPNKIVPAACGSGTYPITVETIKYNEI